jgi:deoxyadenosine/deoxycytidine kinase
MSTVPSDADHVQSTLPGVGHVQAVLPDGEQDQAALSDAENIRPVVPFDAKSASAIVYAMEIFVGILRNTVELKRIASEKAKAAGKSKIIIIDGLIGAGKASLTKTIQDIYIAQGKSVCVVYEPVDRMRERGILQKFYQDKKRWAFTLQVFIFALRCKKIREAMDSTRADVYILERSPMSDRIFKAVNIEFFDEAEDLMYDEISSVVEWIVPFETEEANVLFLDTSIDVCMQRIANRAREEENKLPIEYQTALQQAHIDILNAERPKYKNIVTIPSAISDQDWRIVGSDAHQAIVQLCASL